MSAIEFQGVWKSFRRSEFHTALRDAIPSLVRRFFGSTPDDSAQIHAKEFYALHDVSFSVRSGEVLGIIGPNGAGKTTILKLLAGILRADQGRIAAEKPLGSLIELGAGFHPDLTGRENVFLYGSILGLSKKEVKRKFDDICRFAEIGDFMDMPLKRFSSGMGLRLGFSVIAHLDPKVLLVDEVLAVGDMYFQRKCLERIAQFKEKGTAIVLVSHNLWLAQTHCNRVIYLSDGKVQFDGAPAEAVHRYISDTKMHGFRKGTVGEELGDRCGSYEVEITKVRIQGKKGEEKTEFTLGDQLTILMEYEAKAWIPAPSFGVAFFDLDGNYVYGASTGLDGLSVDSLDPSQGPGHVEFTIECLPLYSGTYYVSVAVVDPGDVYYDLHRMKYVFDVKNSFIEHGMFYIPHQWKIHPPTGSLPNNDLKT